MSKFNKGDVVILKSGGPPMTVEAMAPDKFRSDSEQVAYMLDENKVGCVWFSGLDQNGYLLRQIFDAESLQLVSVK